MSSPAEKGLLPAGLVDALPPAAAFEAATVERLMAAIAAHGYRRVKPPLIEFEASLLTGGGHTLADQAFRLMDPASQRMLALRPDMTMQVARIAATRLATAPRPLRLGYAGEVLRVRGSQLRPERQFAQVGAEIIGAPTAAADAEVIAMAAGVLVDLGVRHLSVDLGLPPLVPAVLAGASLGDDDAVALREALDRRDVAAVEALEGALDRDTVDRLAALARLAGPAPDAVAAVDAIDLPPPARAAWRTMTDVLAALAEAAPDLAVTVDPVENRGFEYHTGVTFTVFARGVRGELGRGGRYRAGDGDGETATGVTLFMDTVLRALPAPDKPESVYLPHGAPAEAGPRLRGEGWIVVRGLEASTDADAEAARLDCSHVFADGAVRTVRAGATNEEA